MLLDVGFFTHLLKFLSPYEVARLQPLHPAAKESLDACDAWRRCVAQALPQIEVAPELLERPLRGQFLQLCGLLMQATYMTGLRLALGDLKAAQALAKDLEAGFASARAHLEKGGRAACVAVVRLRFNLEFIEYVIGNMDTHAAIYQGRGNRSPIVNSARVRLRVVPELQSALGMTGDMLGLAFAWQSGALLLKAWDAAAIPEGASEGSGPLGPSLRLDLHSTVDPALLLHHKGGHAAMNDKEWRRAGCGLCLPLRGDCSAALALAGGLPAVVCLREACGEVGTEFMQRGTVEALHLEFPCPGWYESDGSDESEEGNTDDEGGGRGRE